jgi:TRAP-type C4-dicarboxylate transport system substrate-binding protein
MRRLLPSLSIAAALALAGPALAQTKWNVATAYPSDNYHTENIVQFTKDVAAATGGKLTMTVHANASLFKAPEIKRAAQTGQTQIGEIIFSLHENEDPIFGLDVLPFLAPSFPEAKKLWAVQKPLVEKKLASQGLLLLYSIPWPPQGLYTKKDVNGIEDLKGLKFRAYSAGTTRFAEIVGAQPVTIQAAEFAQALATGVVNSTITSAATGYDTKIWESLTHYYDAQAWLPKNMVFVNKAAFDALDKPTQTAVLAAAAEAETRGWKLAEEKSKWYVEQLKARGMKVIVPSPKLNEGLTKVGEQLTADWLKRAGEPGKAVIEAYRKQ